MHIVAGQGAHGEQAFERVSTVTIARAPGAINQLVGEE